MGKKVSLVLSGGGARGIAHIGVIEELERQGFEIHSIAGTSMGALVGGVYALGKMQEFKDWIVTLDKHEVFRLVDFTLSKHGVIKGDKVFKKMKEFIPDTNIEELNLNYVATATDVLNRKEVIFKSGSIFDAIRASVAIPSVFTPVVKKGAILIDGGVTNNIPVAHAKRITNDILIVVNVNAKIPHQEIVISKAKSKERKSVYLKRLNEFKLHLSSVVFENKSSAQKSMGYFSIMHEAYDMMREKLAVGLIENKSLDILINISDKSCGAFDFFKASELIEDGRYAANQQIKEYQTSNCL